MNINSIIEIKIVEKYEWGPTDRWVMHEDCLEGDKKWIEFKSSG